MATHLVNIDVEIRTWGERLPGSLLLFGHLHKRAFSRRASIGMFLYTQVLFLDARDAHSRS